VPLRDGNQIVEEGPPGHGLPAVTSGDLLSLFDGLEGLVQLGVEAFRRCSADHVGLHADKCRIELLLGTLHILDHAGDDPADRGVVLLLDERLRPFGTQLSPVALGLLATIEPRSSPKVGDEVSLQLVGETPFQALEDGLDNKALALIGDGIAASGSSTIL